jgi:hypothetical protein
VPFFREQSALFLAWKMSLRLHFLSKGHFWKLDFMLFPENLFHFREKYHKSWKFFGYFRKIFLRWPPPPPVANMSGKKILDALFYSKSALQSLAPPTFTSFLRPWLKCTIVLKCLKCIWHEISYFLKWNNSLSCSVTYFSVSCFYGLFPRYLIFNL